MVYENLRRTWKHFWHWLTLVAVVLDIGFFVIFGFAFGWVKSGMEYKLSAIMTVIAQSAEPILPGQYGYSGLLQKLHALPGFSAQYYSIISDIAVLLTVIFVIWVLSQSASWWICYQLHGMRRPFTSFFKRFVFKTLGYYVLFVAGALITVRIAVSRTLLVSPDAGLIVYNHFYQYISLLLVFAFLSYASIDKDLLSIWKDYTTVLFMYATVIGIYLVGHFILLGISFWNYEAMVVSGVFFFMPLIVYLKMFMVHVLNND